MEENQIRDVSERELAEMLEAMPDNVVVHVVFDKEDKAEKNFQPDRFCAAPKSAPSAAPIKQPQHGGQNGERG